MTYTLLHGNIIKLSLSRGEMKKLFSSDLHTVKTTNIKKLKILLIKTLRDLRLSAFGDFSAEITKNLSGGADIYFRRIYTVNEPSETKQPCVLKFDNCNDALFTARMLKLCGKNHSKSRFFKTESGYSLLFEEGVSSIMYRVARGLDHPIFNSNVECAKAIEYGEELIAADAVSVLADLY
jgi:hypothetical protein